MIAKRGDKRWRWLVGTPARAWRWTGRLVAWLLHCRRGFHHGEWRPAPSTKACERLECLTCLTILATRPCGGIVVTPPPPELEDPPPSVAELLGQPVPAAGTAQDQQGMVRIGDRPTSRTRALALPQGGE